MASVSYKQIHDDLVEIVESVTAPAQELTLDSVLYVDLLDILEIIIEFEKQYLIHDTHQIRLLLSEWASEDEEFERDIMDTMTLGVLENLIINARPVRK